jgi:hypothetical protein
MELLLPMATKKLDLSYNIEPDVPECKCLESLKNTYYLHITTGIYADTAQISQGTAYS